MASSLLKSSDEIEQCRPCKEIDGVESDAVYQCKDCNHALCEICLNNHQRTLMTRDHTVIKLRHTPSGESPFQVSGRRPQDKPEQTFDLLSFQKMSLFRDVSSKQVTGSAVNGYKTATWKCSLNSHKDSGERPSSVYGIMKIQDLIILGDSNNYKLKVFDSRHKFIYAHDLGTRQAIDIETLDDTTVVVSLSNCTISLLSVGMDSMTELLTIKTLVLCTGACLFDGNIYCILNSVSEKNFDMFSQVNVYTREGKLQHRFEYLSDGTVEFKNLWSIAVNPQTGILYVTDWDQGVLALSTSGHVIAFITSPLLTYPTGIAVDDFGKIYVCGCGSNNVIQMSGDGQDAVEILSKQIRCARAQSIFIQGNKIFLSRRESDTVSVFELS